MIKEYRDGLEDDLIDDVFEILRNETWLQQVLKERQNEQGQYPTPDRQETV